MANALRILGIATLATLVLLGLQFGLNQSSSFLGQDAGGLGVAFASAFPGILLLQFVKILAFLTPPALLAVWIGIGLMEGWRTGATRA